MPSWVLWQKQQMTKEDNKSYWKLTVNKISCQMVYFHRQHILKGFRSFGRLGLKFFNVSHWFSDLYYVKPTEWPIRWLGWLKVSLRNALPWLINILLTVPHKAQLAIWQVRNMFKKYQTLLKVQWFNVDLQLLCSSLGQLGNIDLKTFFQSLLEYLSDYHV